MEEQRMRPNTISLGIALFGLGTALAVLPAFAQTTGDQAAGVTTSRAHSNVQTSGQRSGSASNEQARTPGGNTYAFGAQGQPPASQYHYAVGRAANDGGVNYSGQTAAHTESPTGGQRTGSASNEQASTPDPHGNIYDFGGQGQPPGAGYHYPVGRAANDGGINYGGQTETNGR
jgi:hypothetical protein